MDLETCFVVVGVLVRVESRRLVLAKVGEEFGCMELMKDSLDAMVEQLMVEIGVLGYQLLTLEVDR